MNSVEKTGQATFEARTEASTRRRPALLAPLAIRDFRLVWTGETISLLGDQFYFVALTWLTLQLTDSALALGTLFMAAAIPRGVLILVGGALTDRFSPRPLMLASNALRCVIVAAITALVALHAVQLWHLYVLSIAFGVIDAFFYPASASIVPSLVPEERLTAGNALMQGSMQITTLIGPALAGALIAVVGSATGNGTSFGIDALSFAVATAMLMMMRGARRGPSPAADIAQAPAETSPTSMMTEIKAGLRYAWNDPVLRSILFAIAAISFSFDGPAIIGWALLAHNRFTAGAAGFGAMVAAVGGGAMIGTLIGGSIARPRRRGLVLPAIVAMMGALMACLAIVPNLLFAAAIVAITGVGSGLANTIMIPWLQTRTESAMLGRVMSLVMLASFGLAPVSFGVAGLLANLNLPLLFAIAGGLVMLSSAGMLASRPLRSID
ncbi:MAG: MFS transporter [Chloroflexota bacterium]